MQAVTLDGVLYIRSHLPLLTKLDVKSTGNFVVRAF